MSREQRGKMTGRMRQVAMAIVWLAILAATTMVVQLWRGGGSQLSGTVRVIDGDSLVVDGREVRLQGIDAPEGRQTCTRDGADWRCGEAARSGLVRLIGGRLVSCRSRREDQHDRALAICEAGGRELNAAMVEEGFAVAFGSDYRREEAAAKAARRGLWAGEFERPQEWRRRNGVGR